MKKFICLLMLGISITTTTIAQDEPSISKSEKTFDLKGVLFKRRFTIELGKGNSVQVELGDFDDLSKISNIDSLLKVFLKDIIPFKDSLSDELASKRIDYFIDAAGRKKIRLQVFKPKGSSFLVQGSDMAALKLEQDTVNIIGAFDYTLKHVLGKSSPGPSYYRISFFVNQLNDLASYGDAKLDEKIKNAFANHRSWRKEDDGNFYPAKGDHTVHAKHADGYIGGTGDNLELNAGMALQNYKNYFVPSFKMSANMFISSAAYKYNFGLLWEPQFLFAKNSAGTLQTYRNDFVTMLIGREPINYNTKREGPHINIFQTLTIGYLTRSKGDFYEPHTFRLGTGALGWDNGRLKLEPLFYFHDFFKGATPGLRLSVNF